MKGFIIDCDYLIRVVDLMYPKPKEKFYFDNHGEKLPLILVDIME